MNNLWGLEKTLWHVALVEGMANIIACMGFKLACFVQGSTIQISIHKVQGLNGPYIQLTLNNSLEIITGIMPSWVTLDMIVINNHTIGADNLQACLHC